jgi:hypothetical protein
MFRPNKNCTLSHKKLQALFLLWFQSRCVFLFFVDFVGLPDAAGDVLVQGVVDGDFGGTDGDETVTFQDEDLNTYLLLGNNGLECLVDSGTVTVPQALFNDWNSNGQVNNDVSISADVDVTCTNNFVQINLVYPVAGSCARVPGRATRGNRGERM